jgi:hypothetical protein
MKRINTLMLLLSLWCLGAKAQIGEYRNDFAVGATGGYMMSKIKFTPTVPQAMHGGVTGGIALRYTCEKYFKSICSVYAEINYSQAGWKEDILDNDNNPVVIKDTQEPLAYSRTINYIQVPIMARLAWGREVSGLNIFVNLGPQFGYYLSESTKTNFDVKNMPQLENKRVSNVVAQDTMAVEHKLDYGIAVGLGAEYSIPKVGHFTLEARYYYGLGSIYGMSKRDYFGTSNYNQIVVKLGYLFDITRTRGAKRK